MVEPMVANNVVGKMAAGSVEPAAARRAITPVGNRVTLDVLMAKNNAMASVAVPRCGFSLSSSCMARMPKGVAALPSPSILAERFRIIAPMAGWSDGTSGNSLTINGRISRAKIVSIPPASATFINPKNRAITPTRPIASSTEPPADLIIAAESAAMGDGTPWTGAEKICCQPEKQNAHSTIRMKTTFMVTIPYHHDEFLARR